MNDTTGTATLTEGRGGLRKVVLAHPSGSAAEVYLHGAHVTSWTPAGATEMLFVSERARWGEGRAIRGGIPIVFPQFADRGPLPKHGFARTREWEVVEMGPTGDAVAVRMLLRDTDETRAIWPHEFHAELTVALADTLRVSLSVTNRDVAPFSFTTALHTYFRVDDVERTSVVGLQGVPFIDKAEDKRQRLQEEAELRIAEETDRVYVDVPGPVQVAGAAGGRTITVEREGFGDVVVWNPWTELARSLEDFRDEEYRQMLCAEAAVVMEPVKLAPGETWSGAQVMSVK